MVSDEYKDLLNDASEVFGDVPHQLCWAHRMRNVKKAVAAAGVTPQQIQLDRFDELVVQ